MGSAPTNSAGTTMEHVKFASLKVTRQEHSLQTATRAWRDGADTDRAGSSLPLEFFKPMVDEVFAREAHATDVVRPGVRLPLVDLAEQSKGH